MDYATYYFLMFTFESCAFLILPARKKDVTRVPWYDLVLTAVAAAIAFHFYLNAWGIALVGWLPAPDTLNLVLATVYIGLTIEGARRVAGNIFAIVIITIALIPLFADKLLYSFIPFIRFFL